MKDPHILVMGKTVPPVFLDCFIRSYIAGSKGMKAWSSSNLG